MELRNKTGSALIAVLVLTAVFITITSSVVSLQRVNATLVSNYLNEAQAMYLADGGLAAAETILQQNPKHRHSLTGELATGTYQVEFQKDREVLDEYKLTLPVEATGYADNAKQTLVEFFTLEPYPKHPAFDYILFHDNRQDELDLLSNIEIHGNIFAQGDVYVSANAIIHGTIYTAGNVFWEEDNEQGIAQSSETMAFPHFDLDFYRSIASTVISGPTYLDNTDSNEGIVFVSGDAVITGTLVPGTAIITSGKLTVSVDTVTSGMVLLIGVGGITVEGSPTLTAALYSPATITFLGPATITGTVTARRILGHSGNRFSYLNPDTEELQAPLPGLTITRSSWYQKFFVPVTD